MGSYRGGAGAFGARKWLWHAEEEPLRHCGQVWCASRHINHPVLMWFPSCLWEVRAYGGAQQGQCGCDGCSVAASWVGDAVRSCRRETSGTVEGARACSALSQVGSASRHTHKLSVARPLGAQPSPAQEGEGWSLHTGPQPQRRPWQGRVRKNRNISSH